MLNSVRVQSKEQAEEDTPMFLLTKCKQFFFNKLILAVKRGEFCTTTLKKKIMD